MKRWLLLLPAVLFGCPNFAPDDVCGYPGFCDGSVNTDAGDSGKDGGATCPSGKEPKDDPTCVTEALGIFVAPTPTGNDSNAGTKAAPVATLNAALQKVGSKAFIFVCEGNYSESVDIQQTVRPSSADSNAPIGRIHPRRSRSSRRPNPITCFISTRLTTP